MKVAIVRFPINDVGGIDSYYINLRKGLERLGHNVHFYHCVPQTRKKVGYKTSREYIHEGEVLSFRTEEDVQEGVEILNWFDVVIMLHPGPHPVKGLRDTDWEDNWMQYYEGIARPIIQIHHDENWEKTNEWCSEVADECDLVVAAQHRFMPAVEDYPASCNKIWEYFPLDIPQQKPVVLPGRNYFRGIVATQWLQWKGHKYFVPLLKQIAPHVTIDFYGAGIQYHYLAKDGKLEDRIGIDHHAGYNRGGRHPYHGFVEYDRVMEAMSQADFSIDLSSRGYTNMTHWEPFMFGTIPFMHEGVASDPYNEIPRDLCIVFNDYEELVTRINHFEYDPDKASQGYNFIRSTSDCEDVASRILENL